MTRTEAHQFTFESALGLAELPAVDQAECSGLTLPAPLIGGSDVDRLRAEGWIFDAAGIKLGNCYTCWGEKGEDRKVFFLADPELYPWAWNKEGHA
jgi:hypothetical protein